MKRLMAAAMMALCAAAHGEAWKNLGKTWYTPRQSTAETDFSWEVTDTSGKSHFITFVVGEDGVLNNADEVLGSIKTSVKTLFNDVVKLSNNIAQNANRLDRLDENFTTMADKLDAAMAEIYTRFDAIELELEDGKKATLKKTGDKNSTTYAATGLGIKDDGRSTLVRTDTATGAQKISIKNFAAGGGCTENLSDLMTKEIKAGERSRHTLLSRYDRNGVAELHYLPLGDLLTAVAGVKVYGTELKMDDENKVEIKNLVKSLKANGESLEPDGDGVVDLGNLNTVTQNVLTVTGTAGSASGHRIRFASGDDSNIKVTVSNEGDEIVVKFDVYYK